MFFSLIDFVYLREYVLFSLQGKDATVHNLFERNFMPMLYVPCRHRALSVRSFALPVALKEIPLVKSASLVLTR
jgi:MscS family membrane protein